MGITLPIIYQLWYSFGMTYYDDIYERAVDNHYLFTTEDAAVEGIPVIELVKLASRGRLERLGNGVYRLSRHVPAESDPYAVAVARVGKEAFLYGESVIALLGLAPTNPDRIYVATPRRVRKALPPSIVLVKQAVPERLAAYDGIPSQRAADAIASCRTSMMDERLREAAERGREEGYITASEGDALEEEMGW